MKHQGVGIAAAVYGMMLLSVAVRYVMAKWRRGQQ